MRNRTLLIAACLAAVVTGVPVRLVRAQTTRPGLSQLDAEMRSLYAQVAAGTVRVQLPMPTVARLLGPDEHWMRKWADQIDANVMAKIEEMATTQPSANVGMQPGLPRADARRTFVPGDPQSVVYLDDVGERLVAVLPRDGAEGEFCGVVLGDGAHVAIPAYVTKEEVGGRALRVTAGQEQIDATFVGSDRQTNVTVLKLAKPWGTALAFADEKPHPGSLVLMLSPARRGAKLTVWSGGYDDHAVVIDVNGRVAGFARPGQVLAGADLRFVADEIVKHGKVKRAQLGVMIAQVRSNDALRQQVPALGARPALRVSRVMPNTAAAAAGGLKTGDLILSLAGEAVEDIPTFAAAISSHSGPTELKVLRDGKEATVTVNLEPK
jgi:S1-C subfamily serine protease